MESSKLPFLVWYRTMFLVNATKKGLSAKEIQRLLGLKRYEPVWTMVFKLSKAMGKRDERYTLEGMIELDEAYFTVKSSEIEKAKDKTINGKTIVFADEDISYVDISNYVELRIMEESTNESATESLKWVRIFIYNTKKSLLGNYHKIKGKYLQLYLNEFVYKLNRRYFDEQMFDRVVIAAIKGT